MKNLEKAILKTLAYADVFDFPLKKEEIYRFLIEISKSLLRKAPSEHKYQKAKLHIKIQKLIRAGKIKERNGFYFLRGRERIVKLRNRREKESRKKLKIAKRVASFLKIVPTAKMVAVTGALAMGNSRKEDDIDLLIVSQKGKIWTTRFLVTILIEAFAKRRRPEDKDVADKICLNMFLDEAHLAVPKKEQDLFSAHEVVQLKPLWDKDDTYQRFLAANQWVEKFLPNAIRNIKYQISKIKITHQNLKIFDKFCFLVWHFDFSILNFTFVEELLKRLQLFYMGKRRTTEVISDGIIRFHPKDARSWVLKRYQKRLSLLLE